MNIELAPLTDRQREVLEFIKHRIEKEYPPTVREMMARFDIVSQNGIVCHLKALEKKGYIIREPMLSRGIQVTEEGNNTRGIPLLTYYDLMGIDR